MASHSKTGTLLQTLPNGSFIVHRSTPHGDGYYRVSPNRQQYIRVSMEQYTPPYQGEWGANTSGRSLSNYQRKQQGQGKKSSRTKKNRRTKRTRR